MIALINKLPAKDDVTMDDKEQIEAARAAYEALTDEQKRFIDEKTMTKLTDDEAALRSFVLMGDVDGDGVVTILDATVIQRYDVRMIDLTEAQSKAADIDGDGVVSVLDATLVQRFLIDIAIKYPINEYVKKA